VEVWAQTFGFNIIQKTRCAKPEDKRANLRREIGIGEVGEAQRWSTGCNLCGQRQSVPLNKGCCAGR